MIIGGCADDALVLVSSEVDICPRQSVANVARPASCRLCPRFPNLRLLDTKSLALPE